MSVSGSRCLAGVVVLERIMSKVLVLDEYGKLKLVAVLLLSSRFPVSWHPAIP